MSLIVFTVLTTYHLAGKGTVYVVENPTECEDVTYLRGHRGRVAGRTIRIAAVECFAHAPPWRQGEPIGVLGLDPGATT
ncbi:MAG: hypothetical protein H0X01_01110 [Nitrospira sp.]|nr:hypothetical protein [Nitrospira sp.]